MSVVIEISVVEDTATARLNEMERVLNNSGELLFSAAQKVKDFVQLYHEEFDGAWRGSHYMSGPHSGEWEKAVAASWQEPVLIDDHSASVVNTHPHLAHKITGGTIAPLHAKYLTIPLVPQAKGVSAREFGEDLHVVGHTLARKGTGKEIVPIYALVESVDQGPWPGAMPTQAELQTIFDEAFILALEPVLAG